MKKKSKVIIALVVIIITGVTIFFATEDKRTEWKIDKYAKEYNLSRENPVSLVKVAKFDNEDKVLYNDGIEGAIVYFYSTVEQPDNTRFIYEWSDTTGEGIAPGESAEMNVTSESMRSSANGSRIIKESAIIYYKEKGVYLNVELYLDIQNKGDSYVQWSDYHTKIDNEHVVCRLYSDEKKEIKKVD